jgi:hypothetical protein
MIFMEKELNTNNQFRTATDGVALALDEGNMTQDPRPYSSFYQFYWSSVGVKRVP